MTGYEVNSYGDECVYEDSGGESSGYGYNSGGGGSGCSGCGGDAFDGCSFECGGMGCC